MMGSKQRADGRAVSTSWARVGKRTLCRCQASVKANASLDSLKPRFAVEAHLANLFGAETEGLSEQADLPTLQAETSSNEPGAQEETNVPNPLPVSLSQQEHEALAQHHAERHDGLFNWERKIAV